jgi:predicted HAD superfamily Cof-like phosphohydrolase
MIQPQKMVYIFHQACGLDHPSTPTYNRARLDKQTSLIQEELDEFIKAVEEQDFPEMIDAVADMLYVVYGAAVEMGVDIHPFFAIAHDANMKKTLGPKREDGKQLKPEGWQPPDIEGLYQKMYGTVPEVIGG